MDERKATMNDLQVPWLRSGVGSNPGDGGCIMQVIDWIDRNEWTDSPPCVHPVIRSLAIYVNDELPDDERQALLDLAPRMTGTATDDERLTRQLLGYLARQVYPIYEAWANGTGNQHHAANVLACIEAAERGDAAEAAEAAEAAGAAWAAWAVGAANAVGAAWAAWAGRAAEAAEAAGAGRAAEAAEAAGAAWAAEAARAATPMQLLVGVLDRYDELTGRTEVKPLSFGAVCEVMSRHPESETDG